MGFFSWHAQDTDNAIMNRWQDKRDVLPVYMVNPDTGDYWLEEDYDGYGIFGGKDFYTLLAELNGIEAPNEDKLRSMGIDLAFSKDGHGCSEGVKYPILVENLDNWKDYIDQIPRPHAGQGHWVSKDDPDYNSDDEY